MRAALLVGLSACGRLSFAPFADDAAMSPPDDATGGDALADAMSSTDGSMQATCGPQLALCDLFEGTAINGNRWTSQGGTVRIDDVVAHRGQRSIRFDMPALQANTQFGSFLGHSSALVSGASQLWVRAWLRMSALPVSTNALELLTIAQTSGLGNFVFARSNEMELYVQYTTDSDEGGVPPPVNTWFCVVWHVVLAADNTGSLAFTSDVLPAMSVTNTTTQGTPANDLFSIGAFFAANNVDVAQPAFSVWFDDVIVDDAPVTCGD